MDLVVGATLWRDLLRHLLRKSRVTKLSGVDEQMAFLFASHNVSDRRSRLLIREFIPATTADLQYQSPGGITPNAQFVARALTRCRQEGWSLIEVHSHPFDDGPMTTFSGIDWANDRSKMPQLARMLSEPFHHATIVVGQNSLDGHYYDRASGTILPLERIVVLGGEPRGGQAILRSVAVSSNHNDSSPAVDERYGRQVPLIGAETQATLPRAVVAIVGLGGLGSFAALELAYVGVGRLILIDPDEVATTNLNRLVGAGPADLGRPKVNVMADMIKRIAPQTEVIAIAAPILDPCALDQAKATDLLLGCVDSHGARLSLNHLAIRYLIPLVDAGTGAVIGDDGQPSRVGGQVQIVAPGHGCLECRGFIDPQRAAFDLAPPDFQQYERAHGYGTAEIAPSVVFLNGVVASTQVCEAIRLLARDSGSGLGQTADLLIYDALAQKMYTASTGQLRDCPTCGTDGMAATGDLAPLHEAAARPHDAVATAQAHSGGDDARPDPDQ